MKFMTLVLFLSLAGSSLKTNDMIELLKTHIKNKDAEKAMLLIRENPEILNIEDENGSSGFMILAYGGLHDVFEQAKKLKKVFSFHEAIIAGKIESVKAYLEESSSSLVNTHSNDGFTPLSLAVFFNQTQIAKLLIENKANPNLSATNPSKVNALHAAVAKENYELCEVLLEKGADVNSVQMQNVTPLHSAVHRGNLKLIKLLVESGASIGLKMDNGDTALIIAEREGHHEIKKYLSTRQE